MPEPLFRCAAASADRSEPVTATASQVRAWLLIEVRGAWGRDAVTDTGLGQHVSGPWRASMRDRGVRVVAIRRNLDLDLDGVDGVTLVHAIGGRPGSSRPRAWVRHVESLHDVPAATDVIANGPRGDDPGAGWRTDPGPYLLVCTNGRHDACCATYGRPLVHALRASAWAAHTWECSHIGGDRFAGNLVILPDGLYFGRCSVEDVVRIGAAYVGGRLDLHNFRGRSTYRLAEQAVEHYVRRAHGLDALGAITAIDHEADGTYRVEVHDGDEARALRLHVERDAVPSPTPLTCKGKPGLSYPSFTVSAVNP